MNWSSIKLNRYHMSVGGNGGDDEHENEADNEL